MEQNTCPYCGNSYGMVTSNGEETRYWHADLVEYSIYCSVPENGEPEQVQTENKVTTTNYIDGP